MNLPVLLYQRVGYNTSFGTNSALELESWLIIETCSQNTVQAYTIVPTTRCVHHASNTIAVRKENIRRAGRQFMWRKAAESAANKTIISDTVLKQSSETFYLQNWRREGIVTSLKSFVTPPVPLPTSGEGKSGEE